MTLTEFSRLTAMAIHDEDFVRGLVVSMLQNAKNSTGMEAVKLPEDEILSNYIQRAVSFSP